MKNILWGILVVVLIVLGVWAVRSSKKVEDTSMYPDTTTDTTGTNTSTSGTNSTKVSASSIFSQKGNYVCTYEQVSPSSRSTNTVYLSDGRARGEFRTTTGTTSMANLMVYDGTYLYIWKEGKPTGTRSQPRTIAELADVLPADLTSGKIFGSSATNVSWDCHDWSKDAKLLVKPSYVTF